MHARILMALALAVLAAACAPARKTPETVPVVAAPPALPVPAAENPGSLFDPGQATAMLYEDNRARRVGDIVYVNVVESSSGTHKADTNADRTSTMNLGVQNFFGKGNIRATPLGIPSLGLNGPVGATPLVQAGSSSSFDSTGETTRESDLSASVGARVVNVLPGGMLQVEGARQMRINDETQILVIRGLIRAKDIGPDNSITTNQMADAKIDYFGQGVLADKQKPGWLARILDNVWPF